MNLPVLLIGAGLLGLLYVPVLADLWRVWWSNPTYSHGILIPFVAGYLVWSKRESLALTVAEPITWGGLILTIGLLLRICGEFVETVGAGAGGLFVKGLSLILVLEGLVLFLLGKRDFWRLGLPIAYLFFMVPLPAGILAMLTLPLQNYATAVTTSVLQLLDIPALREGNLITLPSMTLGVVEACSGIRSLFTMLALAVAMVLLFTPDQRWWQQLLLVGSAVPIAVATNAFRVTSTGLLAHFVGGEMAQGFYHDFSGWLVFVVAFLLLCGETLLLSRLFSDEAGQGQPV